MKVKFLYGMLNICFISGNVKDEIYNLQNYYHKFGNILDKREECKEIEAVVNKIRSKLILSVQNFCDDNFFYKDNFNFLIENNSFMLLHVNEIQSGLKKLALDIKEISKTKFFDIIKHNFNESFENFITVLNEFTTKYDSELIYNIFNLKKYESNENKTNFGIEFTDYMRELKILFNLFKDFYFKFIKYDLFFLSYTPEKCEAITTKFDFLKEINKIKNKSTITNYKSLKFDELKSTYVILNVNYWHKSINKYGKKTHCLDNISNYESFSFRFDENEFLHDDLINLIESMYRLEITAINADSKKKDTNEYKEARLKYKDAIKEFLDDLHLIFNEIHNIQTPFNPSFLDYGIITTKYIISQILDINENFTEATNYIFKVILNENSSKSSKNEIIKEYCCHENKYNTIKNHKTLFQRLNKFLDFFQKQNIVDIYHFNNLIYKEIDSKLSNFYRIVRSLDIYFNASKNNIREKEESTLLKNTMRYFSEMSFKDKNNRIYFSYISLPVLNYMKYELKIFRNGICTLLKQIRGESSNIVGVTRDEIVLMEIIIELIKIIVRDLIKYKGIFLDYFITDSNFTTDLKKLSELIYEISDLTKA